MRSLTFSVVISKERKIEGKIVRKKERTEGEISDVFVVIFKERKNKWERNKERKKERTEDENSDIFVVIVKERKI